MSKLLSSFSQRQQKPSDSPRPFLMASQPRAQIDAATHTRLSFQAVSERGIESVALGAAAEQFQCNPPTWALLRFAFSSVPGEVNGRDFLRRLEQCLATRVAARVTSSTLALNPFANTVRQSSHATITLLAHSLLTSRRHS